MAASKSEYGLIKRSNKSAVIPTKLSAFANDSDDEDGISKVGRSLQKEGIKAQTKRQVKQKLQMALEEDPDIFEYDEIYDSIAEKQKERIGWQKKVADKKPRYIESLLLAAKDRKLEQERGLERKIQKEREAEGEQFADKEAFVTSAYKKKMEEMQEQEEKERQEAALEALTDVTKQKDLSGFYRNLYKQTLGADQSAAVASSSKAEPKLESATVKEIEESNSNSSKDFDSKRFTKKPRQIRRRRSGSNSSSPESDRNDERKRRSSRRKSKNTKSDDSSSQSDSSTDSDGRRASLTTKRDSRETKELSGSENYRKSLSSSQRNNERNSSNQSRESKRRRASSSSSEERSVSSKTRHNQKKSIPTKDDKIDGKGEPHRSRPSDQKRRRKSSDNDNGRDEEAVKSPKSDENAAPPQLSAKQKLTELFRKRTVGEVFESARQRYLERKQIKSG